MISEAISAQAQWCVSLEKASKESSFHHEHAVLTQELIATFHFGRDVSAVFSTANDANCRWAMGGTIYHLCEEPHQPPRDLGTNPHPYPP